MTICINVHNVNQALAEGLRMIRFHGKLADSRNGPVLVIPQPVITETKDPTARVLFSPVRDANPFFHLMEFLWMLAGRNDAAFVAQFVKRMATFSDDGTHLHGAYGFRWKSHWNIDQLGRIARMLRQDPTTRRAVLNMWDPLWDLDQVSKDIPCNTQCYFDVIDGRLNMTVTCRSNDMWWGAHGANAVHFSFLLEYMAAASGLPIGVLRQFSNNYHFYLNVVEREPHAQFIEYAMEDVMRHDPYTEVIPGTLERRRPRVAGALLHRVPLRAPGCQWDSATWAAYFMQDLERFMENPSQEPPYLCPFFKEVARPMFMAHAAYKAKNYGEAESYATTIKDGAWALACTEWLDRKKMTRLAKQTTEEV